MQYQIIGMREDGSIFRPFPGVAFPDMAQAEDAAFEAIETGGAKDAFVVIVRAAFTRVIAVNRVL